MNNYSKDFSPIFSCVKSKALEQCKIFFSNAHISLGFGYDPPTDYWYWFADLWWRNDTDEACAAEMDSATCSTVLTENGDWCMSCCWWNHSISLFRVSPLNNQRLMSLLVLSTSILLRTQRVCKTEHGRQVSVHGNDDITSPTEQPVVAHLDQVQST